MMLQAFNAVKVLYKGRIRLFNPTATVFPGLQLLPTPGHTPGHVIVRITSGKKTLMITGDAILTRVRS